MFIIVAVESHIELVEAKSFAIFRIAFSFFQLADHSVVHTLSPFNFLTNKKARG
jgi:hypothetical protein